MGIGPQQEMAELPEAGPEDASPSVPIAIEKQKPEAVEAVKQQEDADGSPRYQGTTNRDQTKRLQLLLQDTR
jgi:hypothetical protein